MVGVTPCGDKLTYPPANGETPQNTSHLFVFQCGLSKLSLTSCRPQRITKQSWKHQLCSTWATSLVSQPIVPRSSG